MSEQEYRPVDPAFNPAGEGYRAWRGEREPVIQQVAAEVAPVPAGKPAGSGTQVDTRNAPETK